MFTTENRSIPLYQVRTFNDKFSDTMAWLRRHARTLSTILLYLLLPLSLVQAFLLPGMVTMDDDIVGTAEWFYSYAGYFICSAVGFLIVMAAVHALLRITFYEPERLSILTMRAFLPELRHCLWRGFLYLLLVAVAMGLISLLYIVMCVGVARSLALLAAFILFSFPVIILLLIPALLTMPSTMLTDNSIFGCIENGYRLGWRTFGGVLGVSIVFTILVSSVTTICSIPLFVCLIVRSVADSGTDMPFSETPIFAFGEFLSCVVYVLVSYFGSTVLMVCLAFQYGHAAEKTESVTTTSMIDNFENL